MGIRVCPSSESRSITCCGVASIGTPTTSVRGTITSFAVRPAKLNNPWTSSAEGPRFSPPLDSSERIFSISSRGGGGAVYRAVAPWRKSSASNRRSMSLMGGLNRAQTRYVGPASARLQRKGFAAASERGARSRSSARMPARRPAVSCRVALDIEARAMPARASTPFTQMAQATAAKARSPLAAARSAAAVGSGSRFRASTQRTRLGVPCASRSSSSPTANSAASAAASSIMSTAAYHPAAVERSAPRPYCPAPMKARVVVTLKRSVLDPQGQAVGRALASLGFGEVQGVRLGKIIELDLDEKDPRRARDRLTSMCEKLLANTVIEEYRIEEPG